MQHIDEIRDRLPREARDVALNLQSTLSQGSLSEAQRWGVALATALSTQSRPLADAVLAQAAAAGVDDAVLSDARAAAVLMAMNAVYYRFRHMVGKQSYSERPAQLRMQRVAQPATSKADFELMCLAVSALNGCELCVRSHERTVVKHGLSEAQVHDAVRLAATVQAAAAGLFVAAR